MTSVKGEPLDVAIVGAGPVGLAAAIGAGRRGLAARLFERGPLVASIVSYPTNMVFFTSNELLEIGGHPFVSGGPKATRREALDYYRKVADREGLDVSLYTQVRALRRERLGFSVTAVSAEGERVENAGAVIVATGYYANPRRLGVAGEDLPHVSHYYSEPHPEWRRSVVVVGGGNSACEAALELCRAGAAVTLLVRGAALKSTVKYWVRPDVENRIKEGAITARFGADVVRIEPKAVVFTCDGHEDRAAADRVLLLTGFAADASLVARAGAEVRPDGSVVLDTATFETTVAGLYVVGSAGFGQRTGEVFIENGRLHAEAAVASVAARRAGSTSGH
jgi:bacillithiol disulfide reductase